MSPISIFLFTPFLLATFFSTSTAFNKLELNLEGCGTSKGCFRDPPGCDKEKCRHIVTWKAISTEEVEFEVDAFITKEEEATNPWVWTAVGFSYDINMVGM